MKVTGSLQEKKNHYYMVLRVPDVNGIMRQKYISTGIKAEGSTKKETRENRRKAEVLLESTLNDYRKKAAATSEASLMYALQVWMEKKRLDIRLDTYEAYLGLYNAHIKPYFSEKEYMLADVTRKQIQQYIDKKRLEGQSVSSIKKHMVILNGVFREAANLGDISSNPCIGITYAKKKPFHGKMYELEDAKRLLVVIKGDPMEAAIYLALFLGLRRSEVLGLRWQDVNFKKNTITICNTVVRYSKIHEQEDTKNEASSRRLVMPLILREFLLSLKQKQENMKKLLGSDYIQNDHVCKWDNGKQLNPSYISSHFQIILKNNNLPIIRFHDLRATAGSLLLEAGQTIKDVQEFLGHERASTTMDIYLHASSCSKQNSANQMDRIFCADEVH